jgi:trehalose synthase
MLPHVLIHKKELHPYEAIVDPQLIGRIQDLAEALQGVRVLEINSTSSGGGVAELLRSTVPLMNALGIETDWQVITRNRRFFEITKRFHNALQGMKFELSQGDMDTYITHNRQFAKLLEGEYDFIIINDPQPAALLHFADHRKTKWIWRCHIDTSDPDPSVWSFLQPYIQDYDAGIFTIPAFVPPRLKLKRIEFIPPAIDPLSPKNWPLPKELCEQAMIGFGIDQNRPLITQVARFDPWKDPLGVIEVYRKVKEKVPGVQLALIGAMASDDPEAWDIYNDVAREAEKDNDLFMYTNLDGVGNLEVNAFQRASSVIVQKSLREGFGLAVSEGLWKNIPVVGGNTGGIPLQMANGVGGFLVNNTQECANRVIYLLENPDEAREMAWRGRERVRDHFLIPRFLVDTLGLLKSMLYEELAPRKTA